MLPVKGVIPLAEMFGGDAEDIRLLEIMASGAQQFLSSFAWCKSIREAYFGDGYGGIAAVLFFRIEPAKVDVDEWLWVIFGDVPPAYLVTDDCKTPSQALTAYIEEVSKWVKLAQKGKSSRSVIPVNVAPTLENAEDLERRLTVLRDVLVPAFREAEIERA
jgi:hypothetical protein